MYNANYMDGVPVKIAEKYKPPPAIYKLPQSLANKLNLDENYYENCPAFSYDLQLEKKALSKIEQWKHIRQRNKELRKERVTRREEQRKREAEDRQKNLLYSVSYPSTDDLSSGEEEEKVEENGKDSQESKEMAPKICVTETANSFHNILQPTVLSYNSSSGNSNSSLTPIIKSSFESSKLSNSFNYKDFEDDTSSPFDNIELKTINDLDVLAQVLHNTQIKSPNVEIISDNMALATSDTNTTTTESSNNINCYPEQQQKTQLHHNNDSHHKTVENIPKRNNNLPRFNYDLNSTQGALTELRDHQTISMSAMQQYNANLPLPQRTASPQHQYNGQTNVTNDYYNYQVNNHHRNQNSDQPQPYNRIQALTEDQVSKSRSVPDILKELRDEVRNSEIRRYRNCSYNTESTTQSNDATTTAINKMIHDRDTETDEILSKLDSNAKQLVEQISAMGFPLKRVARIVQLVGVDDKKVIEHLIPLSELVDLGFEEGKISDALIRNENNKNKALDDLIS